MDSLLFHMDKFCGSIRKRPPTKDPHIGKEPDPFAMMEVVD